MREKNISLLLCHLVGIVTVVMGDLYLHAPRGSNNRLNEKSANRANANRLFDSQNNNRGGYNVGDLTDVPAGENAAKQYNMHYFQSGPSANKATGYGGTQLTIEWTNQHGCGGNEDTDPQKQNCNMVLQYMCEDAMENIPALKEQIRDGTSTQTMEYTPPAGMDETKAQVITRKNGALDTSRGLQEAWEMYDDCYVRERNLGLFTADQNLKKNKFGVSSSIYSRQNPNGNRRGYECPEERDYFPYWHPTQWKDIAVLAENSSMCSHYQENSFNVQPYYKCVEFYSPGKPKHSSRWNNEKQCTDNGGQWILFHNYLEAAKRYTTEGSCVSASNGNVKYIWAVPYDAEDVTKKQCLVALETPDCYDAPWSRSNHLGNGRGDGQPLTYTWTLPYFPSGHEHKCVLRMRYNISTDDYDPYNTNASQNANRRLNIVSPVQDNTEIDVGGPTNLQMALNTDQTGRVFQDRTHIFRLMPRPKGLERERILNLNVRGKRGNIVQVYPAVEYDFTPNHLHISPTDLVHIQWTVSTFNSLTIYYFLGSDRNNMAQIGDLNDNFPLPYEQTTMWKNADVVWIFHGRQFIPQKFCSKRGIFGILRCFKKSSCKEPEHRDFIVETKTTPLQNQLDNAPASFQGAVLKFKKGTYHYMNTRNNNFTNRSNKGTIHVS
ncbi:protein DD3-3-like [Ruditapes philippinarum]|uniref:protein DD3-3-like n=1 Tax=Ruditapes philippinarum TaxID=129788 RepID=UPI00295BED79|nr:protein DD3-3-like [Ruditapes philippinarum]